MSDTPRRIEQLIQAIRAIPGNKVLTLMTTEQSDPLVMTVTHDGVFGRNREHDALFRIRLAYAFTRAGSLIIRQLSPLKIQREMPHGKRRWIPRKNIYGISIVHGTCTPLSKEEIQWAHCTDPRTGRRIPPEPDVSFRDFVERR